MFIFLICISFGCFGVIPIAQADDGYKDLQEIQLNVGETLELSFPGDLGLRVSKKGIIHPYSLGQGLWQITGIKAGIVIVEYQSSKSQRYLVRVEEQIHVDQKKVDQLPDWICKTNGISCDQSLLKISGFAPDFNLWYRFYHFCRKLNGCHYNVTLTQDQRKRWSERLRFQLGQNIQVIMTEYESFLVLGDCRNSGFEKLLKYVNDQTGNLQKDGILLVRCMDEYYRDIYQVEIQMVRVENLDNNQSPGISPKMIARDPHQLGLNLALKIDQLIESHHAKVVAHPVVNLVTGSPVKVISGGEFAFTSEKNEDQESAQGKNQKLEWKNTGLELQLEINPLSSEKMNLKYKSEIKMRTAAQSMSVQMLSGEIDMDYGKKVLLGKIDFDHESSHESGGILSELPLVGDLFKDTVEDGGKSEVYLWATLIPLGDKSSDK
jgi:hypothetical protein